MTMPAYNTVSWFQVGSDKPEQVEKFYGELFGWSFAPDPNTEGYDLISYRGNEVPAGGIAHTPDAANHATFFVLVQDVAATVAEAERLGAKVLAPPKTSKDGLVFAHLADTSGNNFGVFTPGSPS
ncbi:VOC family protein [Nocardia uniformis]|uniref:VOC family protein n=1 Tax=Nocardia uniformis TaxID=53432 RepID=A0A849BY38_9NOCA|nr:VOC family protein [Nocardia uniformis]NNH68587.1 VOC family protein [Nocardia uniformis]